MKSLSIFQLVADPLLTNLIKSLSAGAVPSYDGGSSVDDQVQRYLTVFASEKLDT